MNRRTFGTMTLAGLMSAAGLTRGAMANGSAGIAVSGNTAPGALVAAQESSPGAVEGLGLSQLTISVTPTAIEGVPATLEAGRYLLVVSAAADLEFGGGVEFAQPVGTSADEFINLLSTAGEGPLPEAVWESTYAGGVFAQAGATVRGIVDLGPGEWVVYGSGG
ncbi:MAG TPA: hypothetical protein VD767_03550, partial [Thermomicrobiales bacterium]|nr:hypothetical protein [Thermomicrobiales bacterium]